MPVLEQDYEDGVLKQTRVNFLGARGIEAIITIDHTRNDQASLQWLFYDGHGNVVRTMSNDGLFRLSAFQWRGVWGERESDLGLGKGYCANLGHPEDETGLVYMRARYYEPWTGRFISEDPGRNGVNWYLYTDGNPVGNADFDGRVHGSVVALLSAIMAAIGAVIGYAVGYLTGIAWIQTLSDPDYRPTSVGFVIASGILQILANTGLAVFVNYLNNRVIHGYKRNIPFSGAIRSLGLAGAVGFICGFVTGYIIAWGEYWFEK